MTHFSLPGTEPDPKDDILKHGWFNGNRHHSSSTLTQEYCESGIDRYYYYCAPLRNWDPLNWTRKRFSESTSFIMNTLCWCGNSFFVIICYEKHCEKLCFLIDTRTARLIAYTLHSSLRNTINSQLSTSFFTHTHTHTHTHTLQKEHSTHVYIHLNPL